MLYVGADCHGEFLYPGKYEKFAMKISRREERNGKLEMDLL